MSVMNRPKMPNSKLDACVNFEPIPSFINHLVQRYPLKRDLRHSLGTFSTLTPLLYNYIHHVIAKS